MEVLRLAEERSRARVPFSYAWAQGESRPGLHHLHQTSHRPDRLVLQKDRANVLVGIHRVSLS